MATMYYDKDADLSLVRGRKVGIIGYGSQGHAHALNLKDSGVAVRVGLPLTSRSREKATAAGLTVGTVGDVARWADVVMVLIPDTSQPTVYREEIEPNLAPGDLLMFAHGFNIRFATISVRPDVDVSMVAPKSPGHRVRELFVEGAWVMSSTRRTGTSLYRCASSRRAPYSSVSTTTVIRDRPGVSVWPTVSDSMLKARRRNNEATRLRTPGLLST